MVSSVVWSFLFYSLSQSCVAPSAAVSQFSEEVVYSHWFVCCCMHVSLSLLALIICRTRPWAEGSAGPPTLIWRVHVCVFMYCSPLVLQSCFAANDPAKHLNDKEHKLPAVLWATANRLASQTQKTLGKKLEKKRKHTAIKKKKKKTAEEILLFLKEVKKAAVAQIWALWWALRWEPMQDENNLQNQNLFVCLLLLISH